MRREAWLGVVMALLLPAAPASAALETILQDDANLIHRPRAQVRESMRQIAGLGVDRVRLTANWSVLTRDADKRVAPEGFDARDPAAYEQARWRGLDQAVALADAAGLRVAIDVGYWAPRWAARGRADERARASIDPSAFADFTVAVARRYDGTFVPDDDELTPAPPPAPDQTFLEKLLGGRAPAPAPPPGPDPLPRVDEFALWNEPNHPALLLPQWRAGKPASPDVYRRMLLAAYPAAKAVRPDATFLIGNTASMGGDNSHGVSPLRFVRELACKTCPRIPGDGWAHHPYNLNRRPDYESPRRDDVFVADLPRLSLTLRRLVAEGRMAPGVQNIHVNEFGYETRKIGNRPRVTPRQQARWLTWAEHIADATPGVVSFAQFLLRDQPPAPVRVSASQNRPFGEFYTGLLTVDGRPKPAARSFPAGLYAARRPAGRVALWVRLRLEPGPVDVEIWRALPGEPFARRFAIRTHGRAAFSRSDTGPRGTRYRLRTPAGDGVVVWPR
jgi:hypothetical protein